MKLDFNALAQRLLLGSETLVPQWLPGGRRRGHEWVCGDLSGGEGTSLSVNLLSGRWADFATSDRGGDLIDLYAAIHELTMAEAYRELDDGSAAAAPARPAKPAKPPRTVVTPVPEAVADCECVHPLYGAPSARWTYWDGNGEVLGYVARYDPAGQRKQIVPWTWDGDRWGMGQWPVPRPLYRLQELEARSADPVLIVEGEKAADAAAAISGPYVVCTWPGGGQAVNRANWKPVHGRKVLLWPDADDAGIQTMQRLAAMLAERCPEVKIIDPAGMPDGWDAADSGFTSWADARAWIAPRTSVFAQQPEPEPPKPTGPESEEHAQAQAAADERDPSLLEVGEWHKRFAYVVPDDGYFDVQQCVEYSRNSFNALYRHVRCHSIHASASGGARRVEAATSYDENRAAMRGRMLQGITYAPGRAVLCEHVGQVFGNKWRNARPDCVGGDPGPWLAHVERLISDPAERQHLLDAMAYKVQNPGVKINHALLIGGVPGAGKDSMIAPLLYAIGGENKTNCTSVEAAELQQVWGYFLENEVIIFNELRQSEAIDRRALENRLKPILAAPPELLTVQRKGQHPISVVNQSLVIGMTNYRDAIAIPSEDRRWWVTWTDAPRMREEDSLALWAYFKAGGLQAGAAYLRQRDVSRFNPSATPPWTDAKTIMVGSARTGAESWLVERIEKKALEFRHGYACGPWQAVVDRLQDHAPQNVRLNVPALLHALAECGWTDAGLVKTKRYGTRRHIWLSPDWRGTKTEARDAAETAHTATVHAFRPNYRTADD
jgi:hypothetical protein